MSNPEPNDDSGRRTNRPSHNTIRRFLCGLDFSLLISVFGKDSEEVRRFAEENPEAEISRQLFLDILDQFHSHERE